MQTKRILALVLSMVMFLSITPFSTLAEAEPDPLTAESVLSPAMPGEQADSDSAPEAALENDAPAAPPAAQEPLVAVPEIEVTDQAPEQPETAAPANEEAPAPEAEEPDAAPASEEAQDASALASEGETPAPAEEGMTQEESEQEPALPPQGAESDPVEESPQEGVLPEEMNPEEEGILPEEMNPEEEGILPEEMNPEEEGILPEEMNPEEEGILPEEMNPEEEDILPEEMNPEEEDAENPPAEETPEEAPAIEEEAAVEAEGAVSDEDAAVQGETMQPDNGLRADPIAVTIQLDKPQVAYQENISVNWAVSGGTAPYQVRHYWLSTYDNFETWKLHEETVTSNAEGTSAFVASAGNAGRFGVEVTDAQGDSLNHSSDDFMITGAPDPLTISVTTDKTTVAYHEAITGTYVIAGGREPYQVLHYWEIKDADGQTAAHDIESSNQANASITLSQVPSGASGLLYVQVRDADGTYVYRKSEPFVITGSPTPVEAQINLNKTTLAYQESIQADWSLSGGVAPYQVHYYWEITTQTQTSQYAEGTSDAPNGTASMTAPGGMSGKIVLYVEDATDTSYRFESDSFPITGSPPPLSLTCVTDKTTVAYQETITGTWSVSGGTEPYQVKTYWLTTNEDNEWWDSHQHVTRANAQGSDPFRILVGTKGKFVVEVTDANGMEIYQESEEFSITGTPTPLTVTLSTDKATVAYQEAITGTWSVSGGKEPYEVTTFWLASYDEQDQWKAYQQTTATSAEGTTQGTAPAGTRGRFCAMVTDADGTWAYTETDSFTITGAPPRMEVTVTTDKSTVAYQDTITGSWTITGGVAPFQVQPIWIFKDANGETFHKEGEQSTQATGSASCVIPGSESGHLEIRVVDANNNYHWFHSTIFTVTGSPDPLSAIVTVDKTTVGFQETITGTWSVTNGSPPYRVQTRWVITNHLGQEEHLDWKETTQASGSVTYTVPAGTQGKFRINVFDQDDRNLGVNSEVFTITGSPLPPAGSVNLDKTSAVYHDTVTASWSFECEDTPEKIMGTWFIADKGHSRSTGYIEDLSLSGTNSLTVPTGVSGFFRLFIKTGGAEYRFDSPSFTITGAPTPIQIQLGLDKQSAAYQESITANWSIEEGALPYQMVQTSWLIAQANGSTYVMQENEHTGTSGSDSLVVPSGTSGRFQVLVIDADAMEYARVTESFPITGSPEPPTASITLSANSVNYLDTIEGSWEISGEELPERVNYAWQITDANNVTQEVLGGSGGVSGSVSLKVRGGVSGRLIIYYFDANGMVFYEEQSEEFAIVGSPPPIEAQIALDKTTVAYQDSIQASWSVTGGVAPYTMTYHWFLSQNNEEWESYGRGTSELAVGNTTFVIPMGISGWFQLEVKDANGMSWNFESNRFSITGSPPPMTAAINLDKTTVQAGQNITATWSITGGTPPYQVRPAWRYRQEVPGQWYYQEIPQTTEAMGTHTTIVPFGDECYFRLQIIDANGIYGYFPSDPVAITGSQPGMQASLELDKSRAVIGLPVTASYRITGGQAPFQIEYTWYTTDNEDNWEEIDTGTITNSEGSFSYTPLSAGYGHLQVDIKATDARGISFYAGSSSIPLVSSNIPQVTATPQDQAVKLSWAAIPGATKYAVSLFENNAFRVLTDSLTATTYTATGLTGGKEYRFLVQAFVNGAWSSDDPSNLVSAMPFALMAIDLAYAHTTGLPVGFPVTANYEVKGGVPPYQITAKYAIMNDGVRKELETIPVPEASGTLTYTPQEQGILLVKLEAKDSRGAQITSKEAGILIMRVPQPVASPQDSAVHLSWEALPYTTKYAVSIYENGRLRVLDANITGTSYTATGLQNGREYKFLVQAFAGGAWTVDHLGLLVSGTPKSVPVSVPQASATPGDGYVALSWPAVPGASAYAVAIHEAGSYRLLTSTLKTTSFTANNLFNGREYAFLVQANVGGRWSSSDTEHLVYATPVGQPIPTPAPTATAGDGRVDLVWTAIPGASKYAVALREGSGYRLLSANVTGTSYAATGLINGREYQFLVQANVNGRWSADTPDLLVSATPFAKPIPVPLAQSMPLDGAVRLYWGAVHGAGAYAVAIKDGASLRLLTASVTGLTYTATGLANGREYQFLVQANVNGRWSSNDAFYLVSETPYATPIPVPAVQVVGISNGVSLSWDAIPGAQKYAVAIKEGSGYRLLTADLTATSYTALGLVNGQTYHFLVQAFVNGKWSSNDAMHLVSAAPQQQPVHAPEVLAIPGNGYVVLQWQAIPGASKYAVAIKESSGYRLLTAALQTTAYTVNALTNGRDYQFLVQANVGGAWSSDDVGNLVTGRPENLPVPAPEAQAQGQDSAVTLTWEAIPGAGTYAVAIKEGTGYRLLTANLTTTSYTANNLKNGQAYQFLVQANVGGRWSSNQAEHLVTGTPIAQDTSPVVTGQGFAEEVNLSWVAVEGASKYAVSLYENGSYRVLSADWPDTSFLYSNLTTGRTYTFLVQAFVNGRWSSDAASHRVSVTTRGLD